MKPDKQQFVLPFRLNLFSYIGGGVLSHRLMAYVYLQTGVLPCVGGMPLVDALAKYHVLALHC